MAGSGTLTAHQPATNAELDRAEKGSFISDVPNWIVAEDLPWSERFEIQMYKLVSLIPVSVTFMLYTYLYVFYAAVSKSNQV